MSFTAARRPWLLGFAFKRKCEETGSRRERGASGRVGQSMNPDGPTHAHLLIEHQCSELSNAAQDRKSTRLNSSHRQTSYAVLCLKKKPTPMMMAALIPRS